jgi:hypothetical protein
MISAWWILLAIPIFFISHILGYNKCLARNRELSRMIRKLLICNNVDRAIKLLDVAEGVKTKTQQRTFEERLKGLDQ